MKDNQEVYLLLERDSFINRNEVCRGVYTSRARAATALKKYYEKEFTYSGSQLTKCKYVFKERSRIYAWAGNFLEPEHSWSIWVESSRLNPIIRTSKVVKKKFNIKELDIKKYQLHGGMHFTEEGYPIPIEEWDK